MLSKTKGSFGLLITFFALWIASCTAYLKEGKIAKIKPFVFLLVTAVLTITTACTTLSPSPTATPVPEPTPTLVPPTPTTLGSDYWPTYGWRTSTPEEQGMDSELLADAINYLQKQDGFNIHSLLIIRNGYVVTDAYFYPFSRGSLHDTASVNKSFVATLVGIAIDKGFIDSVQQPVLDFFPERDVANVDAHKEALTVEDLLVMSSGFECIGLPDEITALEMVGSPDWVQFTLDLPMAEAPGTRWVYCTPNPYLLSAIIQETTGVSALEFAQEHLFKPLGISDVIWPSDPQGYNHIYLIMTPHDMAKLGYLYLHQGEWDGQQLLSPEFVARAIDPSLSPPVAPGIDYGYLWWLSTADSSYSARGRGGQMILVIPELDMIVVTTGGGGPNQEDVIAGVWSTYIFPAIESDKPLAANPDGVALLESRVQQVALAQTEPEPQPVPPMPEIAERISGQTYLLDADPIFYWESISLTFLDETEAHLTVEFIDGNQAEWVIGLDDVVRFSPGLFGLPAAAKGGWESDSTFVVHLDEIGKINQAEYKLIFEDDQMIFEALGITIVGRLHEN